MRAPQPASSWPGQGRLGNFYLYCLLVASFSGPHVEAFGDKPKILSPENNTKIIVDREKDFKLSCIAQSTWPKFHIVYWLANNNFIETAFPDERVREVAEPRNNLPTTAGRVTTTLVFSEVKPVDLGTNFTCVIADPSGVDIKHITLEKPNELV